MTHPSSIHFPVELREQLRRRAVINRRSFSAEAIVLIERGLSVNLSAADWDERLAREEAIEDALRTELDAREREVA